MYRKFSSATTFVVLHDNVINHKERIMHTSIKVAGVALITLALSAGTAYAGPGKDCNHKKRTEAKTQATTMDQTSVLSASETRDAAAKKAKVRKTYSFDEALEICQKKAAADLQACIDYKTGKTAAKPKS